MAIQTRPSGRPEAKERSATETVRHERMARHTPPMPSTLRIPSPDAHLAGARRAFERGLTDPFPSNRELW
jgi:hypothetical protein